MSHLDVISDHSKEKLIELPKEVLDMPNLKMLFLEGNFIRNLPEDLFWKLPQLMWLDLRNNLLENIPKSIANHRNLENLLLTNNNLKTLPNELGLVPNLKALQVADNPLIYPVRNIIVEGTKAIKRYLKTQYQKFTPFGIAEPSSTELGTSTDVTETDEKVLEVIDENDNTSLQQSEPSRRSEIIQMPKSPPETKTSIRDSLRKKLSDPKLLQPTLSIKKMTPPISLKPKQSAEQTKIIHKVSRAGSKISLKSTFHKIGVRNQLNRITDQTLREGWLNQLRILLNDQERILQQERNLRSLNNWRVKQATTPKVFVDHSDFKNPEPPYATDSEYSKMITREELSARLNGFFKEKGIVVANNNRNSNVNIEKLITDLMQQLKEMEYTYGETQSPRSEIEQAGKQIRTITEIQKKLLHLKARNDSF